MRPRKKTAITLAELEAMLATWDDSLEGLRDRALLCFGLPVVGGGAARWRQRTCVICAGSGRRVLGHSKTRQAGVTATSTPDKPVLDRAAHALEAWLAAAGVTERAIFAGCGSRLGPALSPAAVGEIVQLHGSSKRLSASKETARAEEAHGWPLLAEHFAATTTGG